MGGDFKSLAPFLALSSAIIMGVVIWVVLTNVLNFNQALAGGIAMLVAGVDYFILHFVFKGIIRQQEEQDK